MLVSADGRPAPLEAFRLTEAASNERKPCPDRAAAHRMKTVTVAMDIRAVTTTNVVFDNGDILIIGDNQVTAGDDSDNVLFGTRGDDQLIGLGAIGEEPFRRIMTDERLQRVAKVIETPKLDSDFLADSCMLVILRNLAKAPERA